MCLKNGTLSPGILLGLVLVVALVLVLAICRGFRGRGRGRTPLAMAGRSKEIAGNPNSTIYSLYSHHDSPCPNPGAQAILGTPFAASADVTRDEDQSVRLVVQGLDHSVTARAWGTLVIEAIREPATRCGNKTIALFRAME